MDHLQAMATFVKIVESGSLSAAARSLEVSLPVVSRSLALLERRLGVRLFNRTTRRLGLTEIGGQYYEQCRRILGELEEVELSLSKQRLVPTGVLNVNAPVLFGRLHVVPLVGEFLAQYPLVSINLTLVDRVVNLVEEGVDVAIRIGHLADSSLVASRLGSIRRVLCASPSHLKAHGVPRTPSDLKAHSCLRFTGFTPGREWHFKDGNKDITVPASGRFSSNNGDAVIEATLRGLGLATVLSYQVQHYVRSRKLRIILEKFEPPPLPLNAVYPHARLLSAKVRVFLDFIAEYFRNVDFLGDSPDRVRNGGSEAKAL
jgi:DNA-binding transcriptional LysR family regulator